jgi:hypothetical protein
MAIKEGSIAMVRLLMNYYAEKIYPSEGLMDEVFQ